MKAIVSLMNASGQYAEVGMNRRTVLGPYKRESFIVNRAYEYAKGERFRIEFFGDNLQATPFKIGYYS